MGFAKRLTLFIVGKSDSFRFYGVTLFLALARTRFDQKSIRTVLQGICRRSPWGNPLEAECLAVSTGRPS